MQVAEDLRQRILALYDRHLAPDGRSVDYAALGADPAFAAFCTAAAELQVQRSGFNSVCMLCIIAYHCMMYSMRNTPFRAMRMSSWGFASCLNHTRCCMRGR